MKIKSLQISNILTFKYVDDIEKAEKIIFDKDFNILIGQNGAGKSTVLEVINFIFKRVLFVPYTTNQDLYFRRIKVNNDERKQVLSKIHELSNYMNF
ncbi:hypothetical protein COZ14_04355, partial [Candidatus Dojkabacteria bacterium CG_4_10_14_3_um_filter_Dojkabacteria_WS6_41_9]